MKTFREFYIESKQKHSKQEAGYVAHTVKGQRCDECTMWRAPNKCSAVVGDIKPEAWCKWWKKSKRKDLKEEYIEEKKRRKRRKKRRSRRSYRPYGWWGWGPGYYDGGVGYGDSGGGDGGGE